MQATLPRHTRECETCHGAGEHYEYHPDGTPSSRTFPCQKCGTRGTIFTCPNCGEEGGESRTVTSREFQGDEAHGGMVEWEDEGCSLCIR